MAYHLVGNERLEQLERITKKWKCWAAWAAISALQMPGRSDIRLLHPKGINIKLIPNLWYGV